MLSVKARRKYGLEHRKTLTYIEEGDIKITMSGEKINALLCDECDSNVTYDGNGKYKCKNCGKIIKYSVEKLKSASDSGVLTAYVGLGYCYEIGIGVDKNEQEAFRFYTLAAEQGLADAHYRLGVCYEKGIGTKIFMGKAFYHYNIAVAKNSDMAKDALKRFF